MSRSTPVRAADLPALRRAARLALVAGLLLGVATALLVLGPASAWAGAAGALLTAGAGAMACGFAWRESNVRRRAGAAALLAADRAHGEKLRAERSQHAAVLATLTERAQRAQRELDRRRGEAAELIRTIGSLCGDVVSLRRELAQRNAAVAALQELVVAREAELAEWRDERDAQVQAWPRRGTSREATEFVPEPKTRDYLTPANRRAARLWATEEPCGFSNYEPEIRGA